LVLIKATVHLDGDSNDVVFSPGGGEDSDTNAKAKAMLSFRTLVTSLTTALDHGSLSSMKRILCIVDPIHQPSPPSTVDELKTITESLSLNHPNVFFDCVVCPPAQKHIALSGGADARRPTPYQHELDRLLDMETSVDDHLFQLEMNHFLQFVVPSWQGQTSRGTHENSRCDEPEDLTVAVPDPERAHTEREAGTATTTFTASHREAPNVERGNSDLKEEKPDRASELLAIESQPIRVGTPCEVKKESVGSGSLPPSSLEGEPTVPNATPKPNPLYPPLPKLGPVTNGRARSSFSRGRPQTLPVDAAVPSLEPGSSSFAFGGYPEHHRTDRRDLSLVRSGLIVGLQQKNHPVARGRQPHPVGKPCEGKTEETLVGAGSMPPASLVGQRSPVRQDALPSRNPLYSPAPNSGPVTNAGRARSSFSRGRPKTLPVAGTVALESLEPDSSSFAFGGYPEHNRTD
jgi:hypothetical protein